MAFGQELLHRSVFHNVNISEPFEDKATSFYRFYKDERKYMNSTPTSETDNPRYSYNRSPGTPSNFTSLTDNEP